MRSGERALTRCRKRIRQNTRRDWRRRRSFGWPRHSLRKNCQASRRAAGLDSSTTKPTKHPSASLGNARLFSSSLIPVSRAPRTTLATPLVVTSSTTNSKTLFDPRYHQVGTLTGCFSPCSISTSWWSDARDVSSEVDLLYQNAQSGSLLQRVEL